FRRQAETRLFDLNYLAARRVMTQTRRADTDPRDTGPDGGTRVDTTIDNDLFGEMTKGVQGLLSERGSFNLDRKAGLLQVTDIAERLDRVASYVEAVQ